METGERKRTRSLLWTSTAYFGEGLPYSFLHQLSTEYLTAIGAPRTEIGYTSWFHAAIALKPTISPMIDAARARRATMLAAQLVLGLAMMGVAALIAETQSARSDLLVVGFWAALGAIAIVHAVHDLACDGFFIVALRPDEQPLYAGTRIAAFRAAMYVGSALLTLVAAYSEWRYAFLGAGVLMTLTAVVNAWALPRLAEPGVREGDGAAGSGFVAAYRSFFAQPGVGLVLVFVISYRLGDVLTFAMSPPLLRELGMDTEARAFLRMIGLSVSIGGSVLAGWLLSRGGLQRWFVPFTVVMAMPFYLVLAWLRPGFWAIALVVGLEQFFGALAGVALPYYLIRRSRRDFAAAHYGFFSALTAVASTIAGGVSGHLNDALGNVGYFALCFGASLPALLLVRVVPLAALDEA